MRARRSILETTTIDRHCIIIPKKFFPKKQYFIQTGLNIISFWQKLQ